MLITLESSKDLAARIAGRLKIPVCCLKKKQYSRGEAAIENPMVIKGAIALFPNTRDSNSALIEFLLMIENLEDVLALIPYIPYARQDKGSGFNTVARILESSGVKKIITVDIHSQEALNLFNIPVVNISSFEVFREIYVEADDIVIVSPDDGAIERATTFAERLNKELVFVDKTAGTISNKQAVVGKKCVIVDDIVDTGKTLQIALAILKENGANSVDAIITHGVFSSCQISELAIDYFYVSDSLAHIDENEKVKRLSVDKVLADAIIKDH